MGATGGSVDTGGAAGMGATGGSVDTGGAAGMGSTGDPAGAAGTGSEPPIRVSAATSVCGGFNPMLMDWSIERPSNDPDLPADAYCDASQLRWSCNSTSTGGLTVQLTRLELQCCAELGVSLVPEGAAYRLSATDLAEEPCNCTCVFDVQAFAPMPCEPTTILWGGHSFELPVQDYSSGELVVSAEPASSQQHSQGEHDESARVAYQVVRSRGQRHRLACLQSTTRTCKSSVLRRKLSSWTRREKPCLCWLPRLAGCDSRYTMHNWATGVPSSGACDPARATLRLRTMQRESSVRTLGHYEANAVAFRQKTIDHDVSQNIRALLHAIEGQAPFRILDFGCGPGRDLRVFKDLGHSPVGLDGCSKFAEMARAYAGVPLWHQDFLALSLPDATFDGVFANASLFHVPSDALPRVLGELRMSLKPRGVLFCSNPRGNVEGWNGERYGCHLELERWLGYFTDAGFGLVHHYYRPEGLPNSEQSWLAMVLRRAE